MGEKGRESENVGGAVRRRSMGLGKGRKEDERRMAGEKETKRNEWVGRREEIKEEETRHEEGKIGVSETDGQREEGREDKENGEGK